MDNFASTTYEAPTEVNNDTKRLFGFALDEAGHPYILVSEYPEDGEIHLYPIEEHQAHGLAAMITAVLA